MTIVLDENKAREFLKEQKINNCTIVKIAGDASFRSYYRISDEAQKSFILMFAPPKYEDVKPFINIDEFLVDSGFSAPKIYAQDEKNGFLLLEDFDDETYGRVLAKDNSSEEEIYQKAIDCLIELHKKDLPKNVANYNCDLLFREVMLFVDWYLKFEKKIELSFEQKKRFKHLWFDLFDQMNQSDKCLVLRDYHADNLMILKGRQGFKSVGLLDFQDAVIGSKAYDLVSLLEDARRDVGEGLAQKMLLYYIENAKVEKEALIRDYEILSLQRNIKIIGIFSRLAWRDKKQDYLKLLPRVKKYVVARISCENKSLSEISHFLKEFV